MRPHASAITAGFGRRDQIDPRGAALRRFWRAFTVKRDEVGGCGRA
jgi:hypothetical protein